MIFFDIDGTLLEYEKKWYYRFFQIYNTIFQAMN